jgi:hypothetical protein
MICFSSQISARVTSSELATVSGHDFVLSSRELVSTIVWLESEWGGGATPHVLTLVSGPTYNCDPYRGPVLIGFHKLE